LLADIAGIEEAGTSFQRERRGRQIRASSYDRPVRASDEIIHVVESIAAQGESGFGRQIEQQLLIAGLHVGSQRHRRVCQGLIVGFLRVLARRAVVAPQVERQQRA
jgi:hypothetical protein